MNVLHHGSSRGRQIFTLGLLLSALQIGHTAQINVFGPPGSEKFGDAVVLLPNGNFVVTDPNFDLVNPSVSNVGAVSVFSPKGQMISRITGRVENAYMGQITVLVNGNFVITSANGDVTWGSSIEGVSGVVSASNSLINRAAITKVFALTNGHYVVASPYWSSATAEFAGAVTWGNGRGGTVGEISINNSLIGDAFDRIGLGDEPTSVFPGVVPLANGNYVVSSTHWSDEDSLFVGAATFCKGDVACGGQVSAENSLVGQTLHDRVGSGGIYALKNGNYVVGSYEWDRLDPVPVANVGAVTWGNGSSGVKGLITTANSLVGRTQGDSLGSVDLSPNNLIKVLSNGNYIVSSPDWSFGPGAMSAGAVTWGNGASGTFGEVSQLNSFVGDFERSRLGYNPNGGTIGEPIAVTELTNGNYVFASPFANFGSGAITWGNGVTGGRGVISSSNSMVGGPFDAVGSGGVFALPNGHYVTLSPTFIAQMPSSPGGAVTWGNGNTGSVGLVSAENSFLGSAEYPFYFQRITVEGLGGHYVVQGRASVTWFNGSGPTVGTTSTANSLVGGHAEDRPGSGGVVVLKNGNYVVSSPLWNESDSRTDVGAVTFGSGAAGVSGLISSGNSLVGTSTNDQLGTVSALSNGNYVVATPMWDSSTLTDVGAVTWANGATGIQGTVSSSNSLLGSQAADRIGGDGVFVLPNGNYVVGSSRWDSNAIDAGAATVGDGRVGVVGPISISNSLIGRGEDDRIGALVFPFGGSDFAVGNLNASQLCSFSENGQLAGAVNAVNSIFACTVSSNPISYDSHRDHAIVARVANNRVTIIEVKPGTLFRQGFE